MRIDLYKLVRLIMKTQRIMVNLALLLIQSLTIPAFCKSVSTDLSMSINSLSRRQEPGTNQDKAILQLSFFNRSNEQKRLPLFRMMAPSFTDNLAKLGPYYVAPGCTALSSGVFSKVTFWWKDATGTEMSSGLYYIGMPDMSILPGKHADLFIPVSIPTKPGTYTLKIRFDNRFLKAAVSSYADDFPWHDKYLELSDKAVIKFPVLEH